jgi:hypothetical protein
MTATLEYLDGLSAMQVSRTQDESEVRHGNTECGLETGMAAGCWKECSQGSRVVLNRVDHGLDPKYTASHEPLKWLAV